MLALAKVEQWNLGLSASAVAASLALVTPHFAGSLAAGACIEAINLGTLHRLAQRFFKGEVASGGWLGVLSFRLVILAVAIFFTMRAGADPVALLIGLSIAMPATLIDAWLNRPPILDPATLPVFLDDADRNDPFGELDIQLEMDPIEEETVWKTGGLFRLTPKLIDGLDPEEDSQTTDSVASATSDASETSTDLAAAPNAQKRVR